MPPIINEVPQPPVFIEKKKYHILGPVIVFLLCVGLFIGSAYLISRPISTTFIIGAVTIAAFITGVFSLLAFVIRKIAKRYGKKYGIISWLVILLGPIIVFMTFSWYKSLPSEDEKSFKEVNFYEAPGQNWKTYINEPFDLSLRYPAIMKLNENPSAWGFDDVYSVNLEPVGSTTQFSLSITATTDKGKCADLVANDTYMLISTFKDHKMINGREFLLGSKQLLTSYGPIEMLAYLEQAPICKVAILAFSGAGGPSKTLNQTEYKSALQTAESILGSMDTEIQDTGSSDTMRAGESEYALSMEVGRVTGSRGAAFRVYNYSSDNTSKKTKSYIGTCTDSTFRALEPNMTCRESATEFIMYYKMNNRYGYACGDTNWYGIVPVEPKGLSCNDNLTSTKVESISGTVNCGSVTYQTGPEESSAMINSACINKQLNLCQPATISGTIQGVTRTIDILGKQGNQCIVTQRISGSSDPSGNWQLNCLFDPTKTLSKQDMSSCSSQK